MCEVNPPRFCTLHRRADAYYVDSPSLLHPTLTMRIPDRFSILLLDMHGTFMFGHDRFGSSKDFFITYRSFGGKTLNPDQVSQAIHRCYTGMLRISRTAENFDNFPTLAEGLHRYANVPEVELPLLEKVFAHHERGTIPVDYAALLRRLGRTHQLGLVTNIWARKDTWLSEFERAGISDIFTCQIFSSDCRSIKPSRTIFERALRSFPKGSRVLFVGDSLRRDIAPAKMLGLATAWINPQGQPSPDADYVLRSLLEIETGTDYLPCA